MLVPRGFGFLLAAALASAACGRTSGGRVDARDAGKSLPDSGPEPDLLGDSNPVSADAPADAGMVAADVAPDVAPDASLSGGDDSAQDSAVVDENAGAAEVPAGSDGASADVATGDEGAGSDGSFIQTEAAADGVGQEAAGPLACAQGPLFGGRLMNAGDNPDFLALGDLNRDGKLDVVTASKDRAWDTVSVLLGQGDGTFSARTDYYAGFRLTSLALADVDGDGNLDILTLSTDTNPVAVLLGQGDGTFPGRPIYTPARALSSLAQGDLDGDGRLDLVAVGAESATSGVVGTVSVMLGKGDGSFPTGVDYLCGDNPTQVTLADLDGDGHLDIVVANSGSDTASVLLGHGDGTFAARLEFQAGTDPSSAFLRPAVGDLNGDGKLDVVVIPFRGLFAPRVLLGKGGGQLSAPVDPGLPTMSSSTWVTLGDVNGDGKLDLAAGHADMLFVYLGNGDATFAPGVVSSVGASGSWFGIGDLDRDGTPDLAVALDRAGSEGSLEVLQGKGRGGFGPALLYPTKREPTSATLGDLDGDGKLDIVTASSDTVSVLLGSGDGAFSAEAEYAAGDGAVAVAMGDLDGDGRQDVVAANYNASTVSVLLGTGGGKLAASTDLATVSNPAGVALGDLNGDGQLDIAAVGSSLMSPAMVGVLLGIGGGRFAAHADYGVGIDPRGLAFGDVNGDGRLDLVVANAGYAGYSSSVSVLLGKGDGTLAAKVDYAADSRPRPTSIALADLNGDGKLDIVFLASSSSSVSVLLGRGDGTFPVGVDYPVSGAGIAVGDVNGDGKLDIATGRSVLLGTGDGTFPSRIDYAASGNWFLLGDVDRDGTLDLVTDFQQGLNVLLNRCRSGANIEIAHPLAAVYPASS
jgi:hypothetical protein